MEFLTILYLTYSFIAFYFLMIYILVYTQNRKQIYEVIKPNRNYSLSIVIPCWNESKSIGKTIEAALNSNYSGLEKIIVVDDCSTDDSYKIIREYARKYEKVMAVQTPTNTGKAGGAKNYGATFVKTELIGFSDADSLPSPDSIDNMVGFFNDEKSGAVTSRVLVTNKTNKLSKIQAIEYKIIAFTRKLLGFLESIYVTNGPLSIYRKKAFDEVNGFDLKNWTEDIEITWNFVSKGWKVHMAIPAKAYTIVPEKIGEWFKQRIRWNVGGLQTISKYRKKFFQCGMLGIFIMPFFTFSWFLGLTGLFFLTYRIGKYIIVKYLITKYSIGAQVALIRMDEVILNPSILFFFGIILFTLGLIYTLVALSHSKETDFKHPIHDIFIYSVFYLLAYPPLLIVSFYKYLKGMDHW
jgi:cellulose synthase/poly-beta-1,6-N-acetylglucosamine synthase-like glycosyltransferase